MPVNAIVRLRLPRHRPALAAHFAGLDESDLRQRFCHSIQPQALSEQIDRMNHDGVVSFGIFNPGLDLIALGQFGQSAHEVEVGLSVWPAYRRKGLAAALMYRAASYARARGQKELVVHCLSENLPMLSLARRIGMSVEISHGEADGRLRLKAATALDFWVEMAYDQSGIVDAVTKAWQHAVKEP